jgi:prepilin-type N-terminal cleavage/methylation domain-containing protein
MKSKRAFTLVELLVVIAIIAVLLAILLPSLRNVKSLAQRITCRNRLSSIGKGLSFYADTYDGKVPPPASNNPAPYSMPSIRTPYEVRQDPDQGGPLSPYWLNLGSMVGAELIPSGRELYCPANIDGVAEYEEHQLAPDKVTKIQWGTMPNSKHSSTWWHVDTRVGYIFWPQSKQRIKNSQDLDKMDPTNRGNRYDVGCAFTAGKYADLNPNKAISCDYQAHTVQGSGPNIQAVFSDGHVSMQKVPVDPVSGKYWYPYQSTPPSDYVPAQWIPYTPGAAFQGIFTGVYMFVLEP